jgi:predicted MFS family arabinose efflux permease
MVGRGPPGHDFVNAGVTIGPILGGFAWSLAGIQSAFYTYAAAALLAAVIAAVMVDRRRTHHASESIVD